ncbi:hypothetical protein X777_04578 [Ooceraea biroi]|uniref:Uncharacterized protein n=1 Tax=Ooceraea biroi TaxID=2015173 RepID=A0A026X5V5_OOCBI|nr:hypothetical protein X777_04578 [Ooceraea biroi]
MCAELYASPVVNIGWNENHGIAARRKYRSISLPQQHFRRLQISDSAEITLA